MRALIQKRNGEIATTNGHAAYIGFRERGYQIDFFDTADFQSQELDKTTVVVGGVPIIANAFMRLGVAFPALPSIPAELMRFAKRRIWLTTLQEARDEVDKGHSLFIKPAADQLKQFSGQVVSNYADLARTAHLDADTAIVCADAIEMTSEYRVYVKNGELLGCKHYWGDFRQFPHFEFIDETIAAFHSAPAGYAIDFAVTRSGDTVLIEVNDGFALGSYGLNPMLYSALLEARWLQIMSENTTR